VKVLFVNTRYPPEGRAGPAFSVQYLAEQHAREGGAAMVFCRGDRPGLHRDSLRDVTVLRVGCDLGMAQLLAVFGQVLDRYRPDIVHTNLLMQLPAVPLARLVKQRGCALLHTIREVSLLCAQECMCDGRPCASQCKNCRIVTAPRREFAALADAVVGVSQQILDAHRGAGLFLGTSAAAVIHNSYEPPQRLEAAAATASPIRIGYLGRIDPSKGVELLLQTLTSRLADRVWTLAVAGQGSIAGRAAPEYEAWLRQTFVDPRIRFLGFVPPVSLLSQIDLLVVPSLLPEAFARATIEGYAHGVAVIGSRRGGIPEGIDEGLTGLLFDPDANDGANSLTAAIGSLLDAPDRLAGMKSNALDKWRREFTPEKILADYREIYAAVCRT